MTDPEGEQRRLIALLQKENDSLRERISALELKLSFFEKHSTYAEGVRGEKYLARSLMAALTSHKSSFDLLTQGGEKIEVKSSRLGSVKSYTTKRWIWNNIFGTNGMKDFDFIILMGEADQRYKNIYETDSPYVFFLLSREDAFRFSGGAGKGKYIQLTSNPLSKNARPNPIWNNMTSLDKLEQRFGGAETAA